MFNERKLHSCIKFKYICNKITLISDDKGEDGDANVSIMASQARLDMVAFTKLAAATHQRIRRVAATSFTFNSTDFATRIVSQNL